MISLGDFKGQNIFFDKKTRKLYSIKVEHDVKVNFKWLVVGAGIIGNGFLTAYADGHIVSSGFVLLAGLLMTTLVGNLIFYDNFRNKPVSEFHPQAYLEWPLFLRKERDRLIIVFMAIVLTSFLLFLELFQFVLDSSVANYFLFLSIYLLFYMSLFKSQFIHRVIAYQILKLKHEI